MEIENLLHLLMSGSFWLYLFVLFLLRKFESRLARIVVRTRYIYPNQKDLLVLCSRRSSSHKAEEVVTDRADHEVAEKERHEKLEKAVEKDEVVSKVST